MGVFSGHVSGLGVKLSQEFRGNPDALYRIHCHKLNLAGRNLVDNVSELQKFESNIKSMATFLNPQNSKNLIFYTDFAIKRGSPNLRLTYAFTER